MTYVKVYHLIGILWMHMVHTHIDGHGEEYSATTIYTIYIYNLIGILGMHGIHKCICCGEYSARSMTSKVNIKFVLGTFKWIMRTIFHCYGLDKYIFGGKHRRNATRGKANKHSCSPPDLDILLSLIPSIWLGAEGTVSIIGLFVRGKTVKVKLKLWRYAYVVCGQFNLRISCKTYRTT